MTTRADKVRAFLALHRDGFIMPNAWDAGSAKILVAEGFAAIGTTSAGVAFSLGKPDYDVDDRRQAVSREAMFERIREVVEAVPVPVSGDLEAGYGDTPEAVAETIALALAAGLAGGNIEDKRPGAPGLYEEDLAVERIAAARAAAGEAFVLNARTDALASRTPEGFATAVRRANRFIAAGADCVFTPGAADARTVGRLAREIDGPLNVVVGLVTAEGNTRELITAGARRISVGGSIARATLAFIGDCARELRQEGGFTYARGQMDQAVINALFAREAARTAA